MQIQSKQPCRVTADVIPAKLSSNFLRQPPHEHLHYQWHTDSISIYHSQQL